MRFRIALFSRSITRLTILSLVASCAMFFSPIQVEASTEMRLIKESVDPAIPTIPGNPDNPYNAIDHGIVGPSVNETYHTVFPDDIKSDRLVVVLGSGQEGAIILQETLHKLAENQTVLVLQQEEVELTLTVEWVQAILEQQHPVLASLRILLTKVKASEGKELVKQVGAEQFAKVDLLSEVWNIATVWIGKDNSEQTPNPFASPLKLSLPHRVNGGQAFLGLYSLLGGGKVEYVRGTANGNRIEGSLLHEGRYAVLTYEKTFDDVPTTNWAAEAIRMLAATQVVKGVGNSSFAPGQQVTRAEFTALLARASGIEEADELTFEDVKPSDWYAGIVAGAAKAGLVEGVAARKFAPEAVMTREEMAVLLVRTYAWKVGNRVQSEVSSLYVDEGQVADWAKEAVRIAAKLKLMVGRGNNTFAPQGEVSRAESAQAIYNFMKMTELL